MKNLYKQLIDNIINNKNENAAAIFHSIAVKKTQQIMNESFQFPDQRDDDAFYKNPRKRDNQWEIASQSRGLYIGDNWDNEKEMWDETPDHKTAILLKNKNIMFIVVGDITREMLSGYGSQAVVVDTGNVNDVDRAVRSVFGSKQFNIYFATNPTIFLRYMNKIMS